MQASPSASFEDELFMAAALDLARRGLGRVWPNPAVGCLIVRDGRVVGRGWTQPGGRPHAETEALAQAGEAARGATVYLTLEPCSHRGQTPPCADALVAAGVARAVIALRDPDPRVDGRGLQRLAEAGVAIQVGILAAEAADINAGFISRIERGRPLTTLKFATTLDGRIATQVGESQWITGETARAWGHGLRARYDAIMAGSGTVLVDDPLLTCRLPGLADRSPVRVVIDSRLRIPLTAKLFQTAHAVPTCLITLRDGEPHRLQALRDCGVELLELEASPAGIPDLHEGLRLLANRGITRLLVEGGAQLAAAFLQADLADRLEWFRAPALIGGDGLPAVQALGIEALSGMARFRRVEVRAVGDDLLERYAKSA